MRELLNRTPLAVLLGLLVLDLVLMPLPSFLKILVMPGMIFRGIEIYRKKSFFYSHWILVAIWYVGQGVSIFFDPSLIRIIFYQGSFFYVYIAWRSWVKRKEDEWIEDWCEANPTITVGGVHKCGIPYLGRQIGKVIPIWPFGRRTVTLNTPEKKVLYKNFNKTDEIRLIRGIDSAGEKGETIGVGDIEITLEKGKHGETEKTIEHVPRPEWFQRYGSRYYSPNTGQQQQQQQQHQQQQQQPGQNINVGTINFNIYVDKRDNQN